MDGWIEENTLLVVVVVAQCLHIQKII
jgi:hypothetical protein